MIVRFGMETWVGDREMFIFCCQNPQRGDRWTFCVARSTLEDLAPIDPFEPAMAFDALRAKIYSVAEHRMRVADAKLLQFVLGDDIRAVD